MLVQCEEVNRVQMNCRLLLLVVVVGVTNGCSPHALDTARHQRLLEALRSEDRDLVARAANELRSGIRTDASARQIALDIALDQYSFTQPAVEHLLVAGGKAAAGDIVRALKSKSIKPSVAEELVLILGRIGPEAREAVPILRARLLQESEDPWTPLVALNSIGYASTQSLARLEEALAGDERSAVGPLEAMFRAGNLDWVTPDMVRLLTRTLAGTEAGIPGSIVLARLGPTRVGRETVPALNALLAKCKLEDYQVGQTVYSLALANLDPERLEHHVGEAAKALAQDDWGGRVRLGLEYVVPILALETIRARMTDLLDSEDPAQVIGAARFLETGDMPAPRATLAMLRILKTSTDTSVRCALADALALLLDVSEVHKLESLLSKEKDAEVRDRIHRSLHIIRLDEKALK